MFEFETLPDVCFTITKVEFSLCLFILYTFTKNKTEVVVIIFYNHLLWAIAQDISQALSDVYKCLICNLCCIVVLCARFFSSYLRRVLTGNRSWQSASTHHQLLSSHCQSFMPQGTLHYVCLIILKKVFSTKSKKVMPK